jgi:hypothetical protein
MVACVPGLGRMDSWGQMTFFESEGKEFLRNSRVVLTKRRGRNKREVEKKRSET